MEEQDLGQFLKEWHQRTETHKNTIRIFFKRQYRNAGIRETVVKYEMKAQLERVDWIIMFSFFASVPLDIKNMGPLGKGNLPSQGIGHTLCVLKEDLIREKLSVIKQRIRPSTTKLIEPVTDKDFSGQLRLRIKYCTL